MKKSHLLGFLFFVVAILAFFLMRNADRPAKQPDASSTPTPSNTKHEERSLADEPQSPNGPKVEPARVSVQNPAPQNPLASPQWSESPPQSAPIIPPGVQVSPPEVTANIDGKSFSPKFHTSFSERMLIQAGGKADVTVQWPVEHKAGEVLVSSYNDGTINGEHGVILKPDDHGKIHFTFQAGQYTGPTQVILRAANLAYTVNFVVPTGNPNVDPPTLQ